jgi:hypothetical protein
VGGSGGLVVTLTTASTTADKASMLEQRCYKVRCLSRDQEDSMQQAQLVALPTELVTAVHYSH